MWYGCRHHISELIIKAVWGALFVEDLQPDNKFFTSIKNSWHNLDTRPDTKIVYLDGHLYKKEEALSFYREVLDTRNKKNELLLRDDYREVAETSMMLLGEKPKENMSWKKPGPTHKARFMPYSIYTNKAVAFSDQMEELGMDMEVLPNIVRVARFNTTIYAPYFLKSSVGCDAPYNDLKMFQDLYNYFIIDPVVAKASLDILNRHTWYL